MGTEAAQFFFWKFLIQIFGIVSLQCRVLLGEEFLSSALVELVFLFESEEFLCFFRVEASRGVICRCLLELKLMVMWEAPQLCSCWNFFFIWARGVSVFLSCSSISWLHLQMLIGLKAYGYVRSSSALLLLKLFFIWEWGVFFFFRVEASQGFICRCLLDRKLLDRRVKGGDGVRFRFAIRRSA